MTQRSVARIVALVAGFLIGIPVLLVGGFATSLWLSGTPLIDEWACSEGEAPVSIDGGGSFCAPVGAELGPGETWHPLRNHPFSCERRWGWVQVHTFEGPTGPEQGCLAKGRDLPTGWARGPLPEDVR